MNKTQFPICPPPQPPKPSLWGTPREAWPGEWMTHDPAAFYDEQSGNYYIYSTGGVLRRSKDLLRWENLGKVVAPPEEAVSWTGSRDVWAPELIYTKGEYRLYSSNSSWGVQQSCIFLSVANSPEGPFHHRGIVLKTDDSFPCNGIDASVMEDPADGRQYMTYGSFWGGIYQMELDPETGLALEKAPGRCIAKRPQWTDCAMEGGHLFYLPETGYYYLLVSYGSLKSDYNIRLGRSKSPKGPFLDYFGRDLRQEDDPDCQAGLLLAAGFRWCKGPGYMAPGHCSAVKSPDGQLFLVSHIREINFTNTPEPSTLEIRRLTVTEDGWLITAALPYAGERPQPMDISGLTGFYERIALTPAVPQGIAHSHGFRLLPDGKMEMGCVMGVWHVLDKTRLELRYGPHREVLYPCPGWDRGENRPCWAMCGLTEQGVVTWYKHI